MGPRSICHSCNSHHNRLVNGRPHTRYVQPLSSGIGHGGSTYSLKRAIDEGLIKGPRIYPSGAMISQTGGHGDFLMPTDVPRQIGGPLSYMERNNGSVVADEADQVLMRAREQLRNGASQLKLMAVNHFILFSSA